jgi:hypothetical protein
MLVNAMRENSLFPIQVYTYNKINNIFNGKDWYQVIVVSWD